MATKTTHLDLTKPDKTELFDIKTFNDNADLIDAAVFARQTEEQVNVLVRNISCGVVEQPTYTDNGNGTVTLGNFTARLYPTPDFNGDIILYNITGATITPADNIKSYAVVKYDAGTPALHLITNVDEVNESNVIPVITFYRTGNTVLPLTWDSLGLGLANKLNQRFVKTQRYAVESGLALSEYGTRNVAISEGVIWVGAVRSIKPAYQSTVKPMKFFYHTGGVWTSTTATQYNNTQYDDGTNLVNANPNKYLVNWVYIGADNSSDAYLVLHNVQYGALSEATLAQPIASLPPEISAHGILVGQIIILTSAATASSITSAFAKQFVGALTTDHNNLTGLQGGGSDEYYHLLSADVTKLAGIQAGAEVNVNADWTATSGDAEILNKPDVVISTDELITELPGYVIDSKDVVYSNTKTGLAATKVQDAIDAAVTNVTKIQNQLGGYSYSNDGRIFGASWTKVESPTLTRTDSAVGLTANIGIDSAVVTNNFDFLPIWGEIFDVTDSIGNVFVRIPKFYIRKTDGANSKTWQVSKTKYKGFYLPWCFWDFTNSRELPYIDIGKYNASLNGSKLESKASTYPLINTNIVNMRTYAKNNNTGGLLGYQQLDVHVIDVLRTLFFIEFATLNSQAIMPGYTSGMYDANHKALATETAVNRIIVTNAQGATYRAGQAISVGSSQGGNQRFYGRNITAINADTPSAGQTAVSFDGAAVNITTGDYLYNTGWKSGFSTNIVASSGCIGANDGKYPCVYRGIENPFGSVWQFVDGVNITERQAWIAKNAEQYASNVFASPYETLSYSNATSNNYVKTMGYDANYPFAEFATEVIASGETKYYSDYYYQNTGARIARFGGFWGGGSYAGVSYWYLGNVSADAGVYLGGRLCKKEL